MPSKMLDNTYLYAAVYLPEVYWAFEPVI